MNAVLQDDTKNAVLTDVRMDVVLQYDRMNAVLYLIQCISLHITLSLPVSKRVFVLEPSSEVCLIVL